MSTSSGSSSPLGGQVLRHRVTDIDNVRDTMDVDVRYRVRSRKAELRFDQEVRSGRATNGQVTNGLVTDVRS